MSNSRIVATAKEILRLVAHKKYEELSLLSKREFSEEYLRWCVEDYDATPVEPPESFVSKVDIIGIDNTSPQKWSVIFPVWTLEEGESDLSINITCIDSPKGDGILNFELNGVYVP